MTAYGADPTAKKDSTEALLKVFSDVSESSNGFLINGVRNLGGAQIHLDGGIYLISRPLQFPTSQVGNVLVCLCFIFILFILIRKFLSHSTLPFLTAYLYLKTN